jgi:hypothetical protein
MRPAVKEGQRRRITRAVRRPIRGPSCLATVPQLLPLPADFRNGRKVR